jgi:uncharacterized protein (TIGR03000 family)
MKRSMLLGSVACLALLIAVDTAQAQLLRGRRASRQQSSGQPVEMIQGQQGQIMAPGYQMVAPGMYAQQQQGTMSADGSYTSLTAMSQMQPRLQATNQALVRVLAQPGARISIEGQDVQQQPGMEKLYISPPLQQGASYVYTIRASWDQGGQTMTQERRVPVSAGQQVSVSFLDGSQQQQQQHLQHQQQGQPQQQRIGQQQQGQQGQSQPSSRQPQPDQ